MDTTMMRLAFRLVAAALAMVGGGAAGLYTGEIWADAASGRGDFADQAIGRDLRCLLCMAASAIGCGILALLLTSERNR
jgi:hypothetical protein